MYDARQNSFMADSNLLFGIATIVVVGGCFFGVLFMPGLFGGGKSDGALPPVAEIQSPADQAMANPEALNTRMASEDEQRFLKSLLAVAPDRYVSLQRSFSDDGLSRDEEINAVQEAAFGAIVDNANMLSFASSQMINTMIDGLVVDLRRAQQSGTEFCKGSAYGDLAGQPTNVVTNWAGSQGLDNEVFFPTAVRVQADLLDMIRQAQATPARHGAFTRSDEAELQQAMFSVMSDPSVVRVMMAGDDQEAALAQLNLCSVGVSALGALRELPDNVKGRAWSAMIRHPKTKQAIRNAQSQVSASAATGL